jgi:RNA-directed DNA polymerase
MSETLGSQAVSTKLQRVAKLSREAPGMVWTTLAHQIDGNFLREAYRRTRKDGAVGVDEKTAEEYGLELEANLESLVERLKSGTYQAPPVKRVHIPKGEGTATRPIGIPTFEDKVLQRGVSMVLEAVYEQDFRNCSFGFRPGRSAHQALEVLRQGLMEIKGGWVLEVDIRKFFDTLNHGHLRSFLDQRVRDGVLRRVIDKWLKAGVLEEGGISYPELGSPQGGVISPLLANIYLHEVLDVWFEDVVKPRLRGSAFLVRYADDAVMVFSWERDAQRVMKVLAKRFAKYGLTLHPEKTRLIPFWRPRFSQGSSASRVPRPGTFDFLGFTHYWGRSRHGAWVVKRKTAKDRFRQGLKRVAQWCRENRHQPLAAQHRRLILKLRGHYGYFGLPTNGRWLSRFRYGALLIWRRWLSRRSQRARLNWGRFAWLLRRFPLPEPPTIPPLLRLHVASP